MRYPSLNTLIERRPEWPYALASHSDRRESAVVAGGKNVAGPHEAFIATDPFRGGVKVLITGPHGLERAVTFPLDEDPALIAERVRETLEE
jgi:hypothetical protein